MLRIVVAIALLLRVVDEDVDADLEDHATIVTLGLLDDFDVKRPRHSYILVTTARASREDPARGVDRVTALSVRAASPQIATVKPVPLRRSPWT